MARLYALLAALIAVFLPLASTVQAQTGPSVPSGSALHSSASLLHEIASMRTRTSDTYAQDGHYVTHIAAGSLNYQHAQGTWQPIDDRLVSSSDAAFAVENQANRFTLRLPHQLGTAPVRIEAGTSWAQFRLHLESPSGEGSVQGASDTYSIAGGSVT